MPPARVPARTGPSAARRSVLGALRRAPRRTALFGWVVVVSAMVVAFPGFEVAAGLGTLTLLLVLGAAGRAVTTSGSTDRGWRLILVGVVLAASGIVPFALREMAGIGLPAEVGHALLFGSYTALAAGLARLVRETGSRHRTDLDATIDMAVVGVLATALLWQFVGPAIVRDGRFDSATLLLTLAHSAYIVVLVTFSTRALVVRSARADSVLLTIGLACLTISNLSYLTHVEASDVESLAAGVWLIGLLLLGLAVVIHAAPPADDVEEHVESLLPFGRVALTLAPIPIPVVVSLLLGAPGPGASGVVPLATVALTALALLRAYRLLGSARDAWTHLAARERLFQVLATNSSDAVLRVDRDGRPRAESLTLPALTRSGRLTTGERVAIAIDLATLDGEAYHALLARAVAEPGVPSFAELPVRDRAGNRLWIGARAVDLVHDPAVGSVVINLHDITERKHAEEELTYQALHDPLTGLPNRALFRDRLEHALARRSRGGDDTALLYLDLDGFKGINDGLGHEHGDRLLRQVADRLSGIVRGEETVARLGGDEFAVLLDLDRDPDRDTTTVATRIIDELAVPFDLDARLVSISTSIGIVTSDGQTDAATLLRRADIAMYGAKAAGRGRWVVYEPSQDRDSEDLLQLEYDLLGALDRGEFELHYQPIVDLTHGGTVGFEALLRWRHPDRGIIGPDRFIPILERTGGIVAVGAWVLGEACRTLAAWQARFDRSLRMSVNLSGRQLERDDLAELVRHELEASGVQPGDLTLEMTETFLVDNDLAIDQLQRLRAIGVQIALDDFGTGYSALAYLRRFPIDTIKIDRSFIDTISDEGAMPALLRGLLDLGRTLQMSTVAEGIEHQHQREALETHGCGLGQGYLFARPLPRADAEAHLTAQMPGTVAV